VTSYCTLPIIQIRDDKKEEKRKGGKYLRSGIARAQTVCK
jgi:hypothetical protein